MKEYIAKAGVFVGRYRLIILSLLVLVGVSFTILRIRAALTASVDEATLTEGQNAQEASKIKLDTSVIERIKERGEGTSPRSPSGNPFSF